MAEKAKKITQPAIDRGDYKPKLDAAGNPKLTYYPDAGKPGLILVVQPSEKKSWVIFYRRLNDRKQRKFTLDGFPSLATAHKLAQTALDAVAEGRDPASEKQEAKRIAKEGGSDKDMFRTVAIRYLKDYAAKRRNYPEKARLLGMRSKGDEWTTIKGRAVDLWGKKRIQEVTRRDVREHLEKLAEDAPIGANRAFSELRKFFNWCVGKDILMGSPMTGLEPPSEENPSRNRTLIRRAEVPSSTDDELRWLWQACGRYDRAEPNEGKQGHGRKFRGPFGPFIQMLILTGQRRNEVAGMTWDEVDLEKRIWVIPGKRAKNGQPHSVPLSDAAFKVLEEVPRIKGRSGYVFTTGGEQPISGWGRMKRRVDSLMQEIAREERGEDVTIQDWILHDLRRTLAAGMQRLGIQLAVTEKVLNHTSGSFAGIVGVYQVHDYAEEKGAALQAWGRFVTELVEGRPTNVVPIRSVA